MTVAGRQGQLKSSKVNNVEHQVVTVDAEPANGRISHVFAIEPETALE